MKKFYFLSLFCLLQQIVEDSKKRARSGEIITQTERERLAELKKEIPDLEQKLKKVPEDLKFAKQQRDKLLVPQDSKRGNRLGELEYLINKRRKELIDDKEKVLKEEIQFLFEQYEFDIEPEIVQKSENESVTFRDAPENFRRKMFNLLDEIVKEFGPVDKNKILDIYQLKKFQIWPELDDRYIIVPEFVCLLFSI